jgi:hypothetical protein
MSPISDSPPAPPPSQYQKAVSDYRETLKWVVSVFGAVAAALVVSLQLTSLGTLHGSRLYWALASVTAGLGSILIIIVAAVRVLVPIMGTYAGFAHGSEFEALRDFLDKDPSPLQGEAVTAAELADKYARAETAQSMAWSAFQAKKNDTNLKAYQRASSEFDSLAPVVASVTALGIFLHMRRKFARVMMIVYVGIAVAGVGLIAFAYLANPPAQAKPPPEKQKKVAHVEPTNCAPYYLTLDELADDERNIGSHWPARSPDAQAIACGLHSKGALSRFLAYIARR